MLDSSSSNDSLNMQTPVLGRLAEALNISTAAFTNAVSSDLSQTAELLRWWNAINDENDRLKILAIVRSVASRG